jgi:hypothetical protein
MLSANLLELSKLLDERDAHAKKVESADDEKLAAYVIALQRELRILNDDSVISSRIRVLEQASVLPAAGVVPPSTACFYCGRSY